MLVLSDYRTLNRAHVEFLRLHGYSAIAAITYTDAMKVLADAPGDLQICAIVVASKVHGWHHREGEQQPSGIPAAVESWQMDNVKGIFDLVVRHQQTPPLLFVAHDLIETDWYHVTAEGLTALGLEYQVYHSGDLSAVVAALKG